MTSSTPGTSTLILARQGPVDPAVDAALLRDVAAALALSSAPLERPASMAAVEFRLVEGIDHATAERLAGIAIQHGFTPRIRDRLGIRWSSERSSLPILAASGVAMAWIGGLGIAAGVFADTSHAGAVGTIALTTLPIVGVAIASAVAWGRARVALPLVVPRGAIAAATSTPSGAAATPVDAAIADTRAVLRRLTEGLHHDAVPTLAADDLGRTVPGLAERIDAIAREAATLQTTTSAGVDVIEARLVAMDRHADADPAERARLQGFVDAERRAQDAREARLAALVGELLGIRQAAGEALSAMAATPDGSADAHQLRSASAALRAAQQAAARTQRT